MDRYESYSNLVIPNLGGVLDAFSFCRNNQKMSSEMVALTEEAGYDTYYDAGFISILNSPENLRLIDHIENQYEKFIPSLASKMYTYTNTLITIPKLELSDDVYGHLMDKQNGVKVLSSIIPNISKYNTSATVISEILNKEFSNSDVTMFRVQTKDVLYDVAVYRNDHYEYSIDIDLISRTSIFALNKRLYVSEESGHVSIQGDFSGSIIYNIPGKNINLARKYKFTLDWIIIIRALLTEYSLSKSYVYQKDRYRTDDEFYEYNKYELAFVKFILQQNAPRKEKTHMLATSIASYRLNPENKVSIDFKECPNYIQLVTDSLNTKINMDMFPLIDFNDREFKWVCDYCKKRPNTWTAEGGTMDLVDILTFMKYGYTYRMPLLDSKTNVIISIDYDIEKNQMHGYIIDYNRDENIVYTAVLKYDNIKEWNPLNVQLINTYMYINIHRRKTIPNSLNYIYDKMPLFRFDINEFGKLFTIFMNTIITIYDKPDHSKQIVEEHHHKEKVTKMNKVNGKPKKTTTVEDKIVYRHILRTRNGIKRYMAAHKNMRNPPKYTMESWDRAGYVRHLKNGQTIHIEPTTCHRRKELTKDANIHLKL